MDEPTNAVLLTKIEALAGTVDLHFQSNKEEHESILAQVTKTNGRVTALERFQSMALGALIFANVLIVPIILNLINKYLGN